MRSPDSMRGRTREPVISPHHLNDTGSTRSREGVLLRRQDSDSSSQDDADSSRGGSHPTSKRTREQSMWPNPWMRRNWDPQHPLDLNKPIKDGGEVSSSPLESEDLATRTFEPDFAMDLNDLVQSLWVPKKLPPSPDMKHGKDLKNVRTTSKLRRQRSGSPSPPQPALPNHVAPSPVREGRRYEPRYDDRDSVDGLEAYSAARGNLAFEHPRGRHETGPQSRRARPSSRERRQRSNNDEARPRRHDDQLGNVNTERARNPHYDPRMEPQYTPHQYDPQNPRRAAPQHFSSYDSRPSATGYFGNFFDDGERSRSPVFSHGEQISTHRLDQQMSLFDSEIEPSSRKTIERRELDIVDRGRSADHKRSAPRQIGQRGRTHADPNERVRSRREDVYGTSPGDVRLRPMISEPRSFEYEKRLPIPSSRTRHYSDQDFDDVHVTPPSIRTRHYSELDDPSINHPTGRGRQHGNDVHSRPHRPGYLSAQPKPQPYQPPPQQHRRALARSESNSDEEVEF